MIRLQGPGSRRTFTVRKLSFGVGVERTFPLHSPKIERLEVVARGEVRRAKLYYLRGRIGRRARLRERRDFVPEEVQAAADRHLRPRRPPTRTAATRAAADERGGGFSGRSRVEAEEAVAEARRRSPASKTGLTTTEKEA